MKILKMLLENLKNWESGVPNRPTKLKPPRGVIFPEIPVQNKIIWEWLIWHHSLTEDGLVVDWPAITNYHTSWRYKGHIVTPAQGKILKAEGKKVIMPWRDVGYNWGMEKVNHKTVVHVGRPTDTTGAHTVGFNDKALGVCRVGNFNIIAPQQKDYYEIMYLTKLIQQKNPKITNDRVIGHWETFAMLGQGKKKSCPGEMFDMPYFRSLLCKFTL